MGAASAIKAGEAFVRASLETADIDKGLIKLRAKIVSWQASLSKLGNVTIGGQLPGPIGMLMQFAASPAGVFTGLVTAASLTAKMGNDMLVMAEKVGIGVEQMSALDYAAKQFNINAGEFATGMKNMARTIETAARGNMQLIIQLARYNVHVRELQNLSPDEQFRKIADAISKIPNPTERAAAAIAIFGRWGSQLMPLLMQGADGIGAWEDRAKQLGITIDGKVAASGRVFIQMWHDFYEVAMSSVRVIGGALLPMLNNMVNTLVRVTAAVREWLENHQELTQGILIGTGAFIAFGIAVKGLAMALGLASQAVMLFKFALDTVLFIPRMAFAAAAEIAAIAWRVAAKAVSAAWSAVASMASMLWSYAGQLVQVAWTGIIAVIGLAWQAMVMVGTAAWTIAVPVIGAAWTGMIGLIGSMFSGIVGIVTALWVGASGIAGAAWTSVAPMVAMAWSAIAPAVTAVWTAFAEVTSAVWAAVAPIISAAWILAGLAVSIAWGLAANIVYGVWLVGAGLVTAAWAISAEVVGFAWMAVASGLYVAFVAASGLAATAWAAIAPTVGAVWAILGPIVAAAWSAAGVVAGAIWAAASLIVGAAWSLVSGVVGAAWAAIAPMVAAAWAAISAVVGVAWSAVASVVAAVWTAMAATLGVVIPTVFLAGLGIAITGAILYFTGLGGKITDVMKRAAQSVSDTVSGVGESIGTSITSGFSSIRKVTTGIYNDFAEVIPKIGEAFGQLWGGFYDDATQSIGMIMKALSAGDITGAMAVVVAELKVEWQRLVLFAAQAWTAMAPKLMTALTRVKVVFAEILASVQQSVNKILTSLEHAADLWALATGNKEERMQQIASGVEKNRMAPVLSGIEQLPIAEQKKALDKLYKEQEKRVQEKADLADAAHERKTPEGGFATIEGERMSRDAIEQANRDILTDIRHRREALEKLPADAAKPVGVEGDPFAAQKGALAAAEEEARKARAKLSAAQAKPDYGKINIPGMDNKESSPLPIQEGRHAAGTFSAMALSMMGGGNDPVVLELKDIKRLLAKNHAWGKENAMDERNVKRAQLVEQTRGLA